jgi:hypothetical protein
VIAVLATPFDTIILQRKERFIKNNLEKEAPTGCVDGGHMKGGPASSPVPNFGARPSQTFSVWELSCRLLFHAYKINKLQTDIESTFLLSFLRQ